MGPPSSAILGFHLLTAVAAPDLMSPRVCAVSVSPVHSPHGSLAGGQDNHSFSSLFLPLYTSLSVCVSTIPPPLPAI